MLVTGASSGLGREMARQLAGRGWRVAVSGRREDELQETARRVTSAGGECLTLVGSVTEPEVVKRHHAAIRDLWGGLDWAILNAGVGDPVDARGEFDAATYHRVFATNVGGAVNWLEAVLPGMIEAGRGTVAGISSLAAWRGLPRGRGLLGQQGRPLHVARIHPGRPARHRRRRGDRVPRLHQRTEAKAPARRPASPSSCRSRTGYDASSRASTGRKRVVHFPWPLSYPMRYVIHNLPGVAYDWLISRVVGRGAPPAAEKRSAPDRPGPPGRSSCLSVRELTRLGGLDLAGTGLVVGDRLRGSRAPRVWPS